MNRALYVGRVLLTALIVVFSLQIFRVFITTVIWNLSQYLPGPYSLAIYALALFASVLLLPILLKVAGGRGIIGLSALGIVLMRLSMQFISEPLSLIILSSAGVVFFLWFFTSWIRSGFDKDPEYASAIAIGFPSAVIIDITSRIFLMSYDIVWRKDSWAMITISAASAAALILLWLTVFASKDRDVEGEPGFFRSMLIAGIGPWLYLSMALYQNPAAATGIAKLQDIQSQVLVCITAASGALISAILTQKPKNLRIFIAFPASIILIISTWLVVHGKSLSVYPLILGAISLWAMPGFLFAGHETRLKGIYGSSIGMFLGFLMFLILVFLHANFNMFTVTIAASAIIAAITIIASLFEIKTTAWKKAKTGIVVAGLFSVFSVFGVDVMALYSRPLTTHWIIPEGNLRIVTYNIHQGLDADYRMNLYGIIDEIKKLGPDILCLQEVNRSKLSNGLVDCLLPVSKTLGMNYAYGANHDDYQYGNAVLTRYPIMDWDNLRFFHNSTETRGTLHTVIKVRQIQGEQGSLDLFVTHLDHISGSKNVRKEQAEEVLQFWAKRPRSVIAGDLNAEPDTPEMKLFYDSGLVDALEIMGRKEIKTFWEGYGEPVPLKLDYVFVTPDLKVKDAFVSDSRASDHKAVVVDLMR